MSDISEEVGSRTRRVLQRCIIAGLGTATLVVSLASPATAAQPNHQACLGHDIRSYAEAGAGFGDFVSGLAAAGGVGDEILAHLAGDLPDVVIPNTCND